MIDKDSTHDPYRALRFRDFRFLLIGSFIVTVGDQMVNVAIGWELYERTGSALALGGIGLVQVIPIIVLSLPAGHLVDRFNRKHIVIAAQALLILASLGLMELSLTHGSLLLIYGCLLLIGIAVAFNSPASSTLIPQTVPESIFENAATWESSAWQLAAVLGPALGGFVIALFHSATLVYGLNAGTALTFAVLILMIRGERRVERSSEITTLGSLLEGLRFLRSTQVILAAITLDLFAVLLGGATSLLPIYAKDILHAGPTGLGWLRAAPSIGAVCISFFIAHAPPFKKAGRILLCSVAGFGIATFIFGVSRSFWLSLLMLLILGALDSISVIIRSTLLLTRTPDALRGRISAVNYIFVGASNELGGFESGLVAQLFGPIVAVAGGGIGTVLVVLFVALLWPEMRRLGALSEGKLL
ncbi:MAG TPA: MFS transporter [Ktedonobacter sp.]|nr:MFS transporter [Ktedonobacter sp.]HCF83684.1 MFS transporter [Ktedonobacter sp.]